MSDSERTVDQNELKALDETCKEAQRALKPMINKLPRLSEVLKALPGLRLRDARAHLSALAESLLGIQIRPHPDDPRLTHFEDDILYYREPVPGLFLTQSQAFDIRFQKDWDWGAAHVTHRGAEIIAKLYLAGKIPMKPKAVIGSVDTMLALFPPAGELIRAGVEKLQAEQQAIERHRALVANPAAVTEDHFEYSLLNDIFIEHLGLFRGSRKMVIGGIEVTKHVSVFKSNSGKSSDSEVRFSWTSADGSVQTIEKDSLYADNRRNDADRNWGLPE